MLFPRKFDGMRNEILDFYNISMDFYNFFGDEKRFFGQKQAKKVKFRAGKGEFKAFLAPKTRKNRLSGKPNVSHGVL